MSSTLFNVLFAWKCSSTHHKLALDALNQIRGGAAENWRNLCLKNIETYLKGSKAPDNEFKDFRNHVLHVRDNYWGGALTAVQKWYDATVVALRERKWTDAVYAAGVLSHYFTDPFQPYHTGQSEAEGIVHRAAEWSIACAYRELTDILEADLGGWPEVEVPQRTDWLAAMVTAGADLANPHYEVCITHYNLTAGVKDPPQGLDQQMKDCLARLIGQAVVGYARVMERALTEAQASPPATGITLLGVMSQLTIPVFWVTKKLKDSKERAIVEAAYQEFQATGKVTQALSEDDKTIRQLHAQEVLKKPIEELDAEAPGPIGQSHGLGVPARPRSAAKSPPVSMEPPAAKTPPQKPKPIVKTSQPAAKDPSNPAPLAATTKTAPQQTSTSSPARPAEFRFYLDSTMPIEKAPSIGSKTANLLERNGIKTVGDLLAANCDKLAKTVNDRHIDAETIRTWQTQASLCCDVPNLRGHDAQILTACGIHRREDLAQCQPEPLLKKVDSFVTTPAGERILRGGERPDLKEVTDWIEWANLISKSKAA